MRISTPCPDLRAFQSLISGELPAAEMEALVRHLEECNSCAAKISALPQQDTLMAWLRQAKSSSRSPEDPQLAPLMQRLMQLQPASAASAGGMLSFSCAACGKPLRIREAFAGKKVKCPDCGGVIQAPAPFQEEASAPTMPPEGGETALLPPTLANRPHEDGPSRPKPAAAQEGSTEPNLCAFLAPPQGPDELGRLGPYRVLKVLGAGGMGVVFRAEDPRLQRLVALKAMLPALAENEAARQRFLREARAAASIKHDHIVSIYQVDEDRGAPYLAMEYLEGESLDDRIKREGKLPLADTIRIGREIAEGLQAAHDKGLIHRDIKPGNVWLEKLPGERGASAPRFRAKILDFGLARTSAEDVHLTQSGAIVGTPAYMPPEQARGEAVDARCDLYSLGCVLYRMCTGQLPFKGDNTMSLLLALATEQPKSPREINPDVPPPLADLILRLLAKDPAQRPATAADVAQELQDIAETKAPVPAAHPPAPPRRRKLFWITAAGAILLSALLIVVVVRLGRPDEGTITIETVDPDVELVFTSEGREYIVRDKKSGEEIKLPLGSYQVALKGGKEGLKLETNQFTLKRGDRKIVNVTWQTGEKPAAARADVPAPVQIPEPPPLAEWLKDRKVLTVSQDGKAQFKTIQAALDALKPGRVVKVLDRGPYRECLTLDNVPADSGLVSEQGTILDFPGNWRKLHDLPGGALTGHYLCHTSGFRLHGFCFTFPEKKGSAGLVLYQPDGFVLENCWFRTLAQDRDSSRPDPQQALCLSAWQIDFARPVVIRDSRFNGSVNLVTNAKEELRGTDLVVERNYFTNFCGVAGAFRKLILRGNVFGSTPYHYFACWNLKDAALVEISNNTLLRDVLFQISVPRGTVHLCNNLVTGREGILLADGAEKALAEMSKNWQSHHNVFQGHSGSRLLPLGATDRLAPISFLSQEPDDANYLRIAADGPAAKGGAGGAWPSYIGALPPGPAPKDGDWFTRLRQKWPENKVKADK